MYAGSTGYKEKISRLINWGHWFAFGNILLSLLIAVKYLDSLPGGETVLAQMFIYSSWLGHFAFLSFAVYLLTLFPLTLVLPNSAAIRFIGIFFASFCQVALIADAYLYSRYGFHLNLFFIDLLVEDGELMTATLKTWTVVSGSILLLLLIEVVMALVIWKRLKNYRQRHVGFWVGAPLMVAFVSSHLLHVWADAVNYSPITQRAYLFPLSYPTTAKSMLESYGMLPEDNPQQLATLDYPLDTLECESSEMQPAVVLITVDGLRFDAVTAEQMPQTTQLSLQSLVFSNHFSGGSGASPSSFMLDYSIPRSYQAAVRKDNSQPVLSSSFASAGYPVAEFSLSHAPAGDATAQSPVDEWRQWLSQQAQPGFSALRLPGPVIDSQSPDKARAAYQQFLQATDRTIGQILEAIEQSRFESTTVVIVTGTYGYELNDTQTGQWGADSNYSRWQLQVPMIINWPGKAPARQPLLTSHYDLAPTLMRHALECRNSYRQFSVGQDMFDPKEDERVVLGDGQSLAIIEHSRTTVIDDDGNYEIRNRDYRLVPHERLGMAGVLKAIHETRRYYSETGKRQD